MNDDKKADSETGKDDPADKPERVPAETYSPPRKLAILTAIDNYTERKLAEQEARKLEAQAKVNRAAVEVADSWEELTKRQERHEHLPEIRKQVTDEVFAERNEAKLKRERSEAELSAFQDEQKTKRAERKADRAEALLRAQEATAKLRSAGRQQAPPRSVEERIEELQAKLAEVRAERQAAEATRGTLSEGETKLFNKKEALIIEQIDKLQGEF